MTFNPTTTIVVVVVLAVVALIGWAVQTANRLDRLNVRVDLARQSLHASLDRRAVVARTIATDIAATDRNPAAQESARDLIAVALGLAAHRFLTPGVATAGASSSRGRPRSWWRRAAP